MINFKALTKEVNVQGTNKLETAKNTLRAMLSILINKYRTSPLVLELFGDVFKRWLKNEKIGYNRDYLLELLSTVDNPANFKAGVATEKTLGNIYEDMQGYISIGGRGGKLYAIPLNAYLNMGDFNSKIRFLYMQYVKDMQKYMFIDKTIMFTESGDAKTIDMTIQFSYTVPGALFGDE